MNNQEFEELLKTAKLSKKDFSQLVEMNYNSVTNWNKSDKIPQWVESWLNLYIENQEYKKFKELLRDSGVCDGENR